MKVLFSFFSILSIFLGIVTIVSAHVTVKPDTVAVGKFQTFTVSVPNEKEMATTGVRVIIPEGLKYVSPNVKPGWNIEVMKTGEGEEVKVTEIIWSAGSIPVGQRDEFLFSAQVPSSEGTLIWKAYQTYEDGTIVSWDSTSEEHSDDHAETGPASKTNVVNDLAVTTSETEEKVAVKSDSTTLVIAYAALALAAISLALNLRRNRS